MKKNNFVICLIIFCAFMPFVLAIVKLLGMVKLSWIAVFSPMWISIVISSVFALIVLVFVLIVFGLAKLLRKLFPAGMEDEDEQK